MQLCNPNEDRPCKFKSSNNAKSENSAAFEFLKLRPFYVMVITSAARNCFSFVLCNAEPYIWYDYIYKENAAQKTREMAHKQEKKWHKSTNM